MPKLIDLDRAASDVQTDALRAAVQEGSRRTMGDAEFTASGGTKETGPARVRLGASADFAATGMKPIN